jgi:hypothetical protein
MMKKEEISNCKCTYITVNIQLTSESSKYAKLANKQGNSSFIHQVSLSLISSRLVVVRTKLSFLSIFRSYKHIAIHNI